MSNQELQARYLLIAIIATRQAADYGYETGFEEKAQELGLL